MSFEVKVIKVFYFVLFDRLESKERESEGGRDRKRKKERKSNVNTTKEVVINVCNQPNGITSFKKQL